MSTKATSTCDTTRRYFDKRNKAAPSAVWARPSTVLRGSVEWLAAHHVAKTHLKRLVGFAITTYNRWHRLSVWPTHSRGYALCLLVKALKAERWPMKRDGAFLSPAAFVAHYEDEESFQYTRFELGLQWLQVLDKLVAEGYTLTELAALTGATPSSLTYIARGAQWPRFAVGELLLDLYWQVRDDDPTRIRPANANPGRVPARSSFMLDELPDMPFTVMRPVVYKRPGSHRLVEVAAEL